MKNVIIIGAGAHAAEVDEYIYYSQETVSAQLKIIGFLDDNPENYSAYQFSAPLLGNIKNHKVRTDIWYIIGIANLEYRKYFVQRFCKAGAQFLSFIHPSCYLSRTATIGEGSVIGPNVTIGPNVKIGNFNLINSRSSISHDSVIGNFNFISPNVCFSGFTKIGDDNIMGINSATIPHIRIGHRNKIAAGMILDTDLEDDQTIFHRFKERVIAVPKKQKTN